MNLDPGRECHLSLEQEIIFIPEVGFFWGSPKRPPFLLAAHLYIPLHLYIFDFHLYIDGFVM